jgi:hypothetical protein
MAKLYPHLTEELDTEFLYKDLVQAYTSNRNNQNLARIREQIRQRHSDHNTWLVQHGYQCGRDYQLTMDGYRFASPALVTAFVLGNSQ